MMTLSLCRCHPFSIAFLSWENDDEQHNIIMLWSCKSKRTMMSIARCRSVILKTIYMSFESLLKLGKRWYQLHQLSFLQFHRSLQQQDLLLLNWSKRNVSKNLINNMDWDLVICLFFYGAKVVYFASEMKLLKDDCECFEIFPPSHIYSNKSSQKQQQIRNLCYQT
jgi:hypothetical protein